MWARREEAETDRAGKAPAKRDARVCDIVAEYVTAVGPMSRSKEGAIAHISALIGRRRLADIDVATLRTFAAMRESEGAGPATIG